MTRKYSLILAVLLAGLLAFGCGGEQAGTPEEGATDTTATTMEEPTAEQPAEATAEKPAEPATRQETATPKPKPTTVTVTLPESTAVRVAFVDSIDTDVHQTGDEFRAVLLAPVKVDGRTVFDSGATATGVLDSVVESGRLDKPAEVEFHLVSITGRDGKPVSIDTYTIYEKKGSKTGRDVAIIGGGAVVGGIVGKITGKKGGTEIGAIAGAAAGTGVAAATGKQDIVHSAGTEAVFVTSAPVTVTVPR